MTTSDWGDWLPREVAGAETDGIAIWYLGCNGFALKASDGTTVWVDPYLGVGDPPRTVRMIPVPFDPGDVQEAAGVFATHEHTDHVHGPSQAPIVERTDATFYGPDDSLAVARDEERWPEEYAVDDHQFTAVEAGDSLDVGGFSVSVEMAHDPDAIHPVSYVFEHDGRTVFHGGDTKPHEDFQRIGETYDVDVGILAFGSVGNVRSKTTGEVERKKWYNDENQIVEAASALAVDRLLPSHWDMWKGLTADPTALHPHVRSFEYPRSLEIVEIGDRVEV